MLKQTYQIKKRFHIYTYLGIVKKIIIFQMNDFSRLQLPLYKTMFTLEHFLLRK